jgi:hypothetical protein
MTKFKVAFTMDSKTLFLIMSKMLPIEDLKVEEKLDEAELHQALKSLAGRHEQKILAHNYPKPKYKKKRASIPFNPDKGINKILLDHLARRSYRAGELKKPLQEGGYSANSVNSRLQELAHRGVVIRHSDGLWSLAESDQAKLGQTQRGDKLHG